MGDLFLIGIGIVLCILFKKYDDNQKAKLKLAQELAEKAHAKAAKRKDKTDEVNALRAQVEELSRLVREGRKNPSE
jgi:hypothetical protein